MSNNIFKHKRIAIDFDGTLVEDSLDINKDFELDKPLKALNGASETTKELHENGFEILIYTCRPDYHRQYMENILKTNNITYDYILFYTKPRVDLYIDNKGYRFENWDDTKQWIKKKLKT
jgi:phosphoglycolate phosphatase-like HAD superfamily hydrolase